MSTSGYLLRPSSPDDLPDLERFGAASAFGVNSLPSDRERLRQKLLLSQQSFQAKDDPSGEERYLFVLEDRATGRVIGTSGIAATAGFHDRFYSYRNEYLVHASEALGEVHRLHTLHLCHDLTAYTLLTSFYIEPEYEHTLAPQLLSRARLLFIAEYADRFSDRIAAESPGLCDELGHCPFWDAVGRRFFNMDYPQIEQLCEGRSKSFIADLMPHSPVYVPLLPEAAQWSLGQLHPDAELPFSILLDEGFEAETYLDIFDGGPIVESRLPLIKTIRNGWHGPLQTAADTPAGSPYLIVKPGLEDFRATIAPATLGSEGLSVPETVASLLQTQAGATVRAAPLKLG
ncbi:arginine N-succinyltransferase [Chitinimonas sp.]|uniref:arginine N-succinyltransferase n=1 Tax=Chitinimonas sp. TaxID=1934313 RepID=UPI002F938F66